MLQSELRFLEAELGIGFTSCRIAVQAKSNQKRERNLANARKAYDAIVYFRPKQSSARPIPIASIPN
jgi:hypothetical protein